MRLTQTPRLAVEPLEVRELPAISALLSGTTLTIQGSEGADLITLWQSRGRLSVLEAPIQTTSGKVTSVAATSVQRIFINGKGGNDNIKLNQDLYGADPITAPATIYGGSGDDYLVGGWGRDVIDGGTGNDKILGYLGNDWLVGGDGNDQLYGQSGNDTLFGQNGNDYLQGGAGDDSIRGGAGSDTLFGEGGNDKLWGESNWDILRGGDGNDYLDAGSAGEDVGGDGGFDTDAWKWAVGGYLMTDVAQRASPTCSFLASLASVARRRPGDLASHLTYLGNGVYRVKLFRPTPGTTTGVWVYQNVSFDGATTSFDPKTVAEGKFWVTLYHRAWVQERKAIGESPEAFPDDALTALTGVLASGGAASSRSFLSWAVNTGRAVVASSWEVRSGFSSKVIPSHAYTVLSMDSAGTMQLRNPWGFDGATPSGNASDGIITLSWTEFTSSFYAFYVV